MLHFNLLNVSFGLPPYHHLYINRYNHSVITTWTMNNQWMIMDHMQLKLNLVAEYICTMHAGKFTSFCRHLLLQVRRKRPTMRCSALSSFDLISILKMSELNPSSENTAPLFIIN